MIPGLVIAVDDPEARDVRDLLAVHLSFARSVTPVEYSFALNVAQLKGRDVTFVSARQDGALIAVGALKRLDESHAELKSMHVAEAARGQGVGRAMVEYLLAFARHRGFSRVSLETGTVAEFAPAQALYTSAGFRPCEPFGEYTATPYNTCMTISLVRRQA